ncbi:potassium voltage-gated channel subfamily H member 4-like [Neopsephotus bourkii]|uniref:potassium voltage-gated channel subfamily H member 4-like n=1 Tax=Neopsephotus bourkii TaxID=309878 RepID=UPI002AA55013|nr:potassium voltage-gated channel subfamily H member 4-like [Neopsephotus bourkii]XP_061216548.1 potassium voltage-gated channel subfamily H member 4-like [Neopsephotus bourkii]
MAGAGQRLLLALVLGGAALWGEGGAPFELREALGGLRGENARLEGALRNLSRALGLLRLREPPDLSWTQGPPFPDQPPPCYRGAPPTSAAAPPPTLGGVTLGVGGIALLML